MSWEVYQWSKMNMLEEFDSSKNGVFFSCIFDI